MSTEVRNWDVVAKAMEAAGATSSEMYIRAKALALGKLDPMPTSSPEAPYSISAVAGWALQIKASHLWGSPTQSIKDMTALTQSTSRYVVRYKDLEGILHEDNVYAHDVITAQNMAMEISSDLKKRPHLISAILKDGWSFLNSIKLTQFNALLKVGEVW